MIRPLAPSRAARRVFPPPWEKDAAMEEEMHDFEEELKPAAAGPQPVPSGASEAAAQAAAYAATALAPAIVESPRAAGPMPAPRFADRLARTLEMIKFKHTIFALPFAALSALIAAEGLPTAYQSVWILLACVFARSAAMAFNRLHDEEFDRQNPRTKGWALPAGLLSRRFVAFFCLASVLGFVASAAMLNTLALVLSPLALVVLLGYSRTKRYTAACHFILGLGLGIAPLGAWVAVRGELFALAPFMLAAGVMFWTAGFDIIYSMQDEAVDRKLGLKSLPATLGPRRALAISALSHIVALLCFLALEMASPLGNWYLVSIALAAWLLYYEQTLVSPTDISRVNAAFFTINGWVSVALLAGGALDLYLR